MSEKYGQAFPGTIGNGGWEGMSLRDWFAGQALTLFSTRQSNLGIDAETLAKALARAAYMQADAMLTERERVK